MKDDERLDIEEQTESSTPEKECGCESQSGLDCDTPVPENDTWKQDNTTGPNVSINDNTFSPADEETDDAEEPVQPFGVSISNCAFKQDIQTAKVAETLARAVESQALANLTNAGAIRSMADKIQANTVYCLKVLPTEVSGFTPPDAENNEDA